MEVDGEHDELKRQAPLTQEAELDAAEVVQVPADCPFELEQIASLYTGECLPGDLLTGADRKYTGRSRITHLLTIAARCPAWAGQALTLALDAIKLDTLDTALYEHAYDMYKHHCQAVADGTVTDPLAKAWSDQHSPVQLDSAWLDRTRKEYEQTTARLETELKGYTTNLIKESIRMAHRDLARHQYKSGDLHGAIRSYSKSREYCTTSQHVLEMCLGVALELPNYSFVRTYVVKAESALEAMHQPNQNKPRQQQVNLPGMVAPAADPVEVAKDKERKSLTERLTVAGAVAMLGQRAYDQCALALTSIGKEALDSKEGHFVPPADIALYAAITGLATFTRNDLRARLLDNANLRPMFDSEPYLRDMVRSFYSNNFKDGLQSLERHKLRQRLDPHLESHLVDLYDMIQSRAIVTYFTPFATVSMPRMSEAFGWSEQHLLDAVTHLIDKGHLQARIDTRSRTLVAKNKDARVEAFKNALKQGDQIQRKTLANQLRLKLIQHDLVVKMPRAKDSHQQQHMMEA
ncbi:hypothetical protein OIV83_005341 [Microbotryomycetes sp. JL201]|nr:hypothetical protein OIV83_005341 [Microbotryomycetes sp. JL201]